jgi:YebC/PmpR family DNA-binding regulatory protein
MSGHNKWSKIKHKKAATDSARSKVFTRLVRLIQVEAKLANGNVDSPGLKAAIEKAHKENMPKDNIERAIKKASESGDVTPVLFEVYGPAGVGIIITALTDNNNRTSSEMKHLIDKQGASFGAQGSVSWNFTKNIGTGDWEPGTLIDLEDDDLEKLGRLVDAIEEYEDVQDVFTNAS